MKGDFSGNKFQKDKHYNSVRMQQGRVQLDADWNENVDISEHRQRTETREVIGPCGTPIAGSGFKTEFIENMRDLLGVHFVDETAGWAVGFFGIFATHDGADSWEEPPFADLPDTQRSAFWFYGVDVHFVNESKGWAVGMGVLTTDDGGRTWRQQKLPPGGEWISLYSVDFVNDSTGWAVGDHGRIVATDDGGLQWTTKHSGITKHLHSVAFVDELTGCAVGASGAILVSTDGGEQWVYKESGVEEHLYSVAFLNGSAICAVGAHGTILISTDDQNNVWETRDFGVQEHLFDVCFVNESSGCAVGNSGTIVVTNDGGDTWETKSSGVPEKLSGVSFVSESKGWAVGERGRVLLTDDGGETWHTQPRIKTVAIPLVYPGHLYSGGMVCELEDWLLYPAQPDYPDPKPLLIYEPEGDERPRTVFAYLDVWERHITAIEDPGIRETALGGPDTTTRVKTVWQVKIIENIGDEITCENQVPDWPPAPSEARLNTRVSPQAAEQQRCEIGAFGGYHGIENRLYRVEIHCEGEAYMWPRPGCAVVDVTDFQPDDRQVTVAGLLDDRPWQIGQIVELFSAETEQQQQPGLVARIVAINEMQLILTLDADLSELIGHTGYLLRRVAAFKWSHDNGSIAFAIEGFIDSEHEPTTKVKLKDFGRDPALNLPVGSWVEISDDISELRGEVGRLASIFEPVDVGSGIATLNRRIPHSSISDHPKLRCWDQQEETITVTDEWVNLEDGIQVQLYGTNFKIADYWNFAARATTGEVEQLTEELALGIKHDYCPLTFLIWKPDGTTETVDRRPQFPTATEIKSFFYLGGDGQTTGPGRTLPQPLRAGVAQGKWPITGAMVKFKVVKGQGQLEGAGKTGSEIDVTTEDGVAECTWILDHQTADQVVEARLTDPCGGSLHLPIHFNGCLAETGPGNGLCWKLGGNDIESSESDYLGTNNDKALQFYVNSEPTFRLEPRIDQQGGPAANVIGGSNNFAGDGLIAATIAGGQSNRVLGDGGAVAGGYGNRASGSRSAVGGGEQNIASGIAAAINGGQNNKTSAYVATIGGGKDNKATGNLTTIGGGATNNAVSVGSTVGGGRENISGWTQGGISHEYSTVAGGRSNVANGQNATVGGGYYNRAEAEYATVAGGGGIHVDPDTDAQYPLGNTASGASATVGGGKDNVASGDCSTIGGGGHNQAGGEYATIPGGYATKAVGAYSFTAGYHAEALHDGAFVWADHNQNSIFKSEQSNQFSVRATGGIRFVSALEGGDPTSGVRLYPGSNAWSNLIPKNATENSTPVDPKTVLDRLRKLPIVTWNYRSQDASVRHISPVAEDFYTAFSLGEDKQSISTVDADGVALAAIQSLYEIVQEKDAKLIELERTLKELQARLATLEARSSDEG